MDPWLTDEVKELLFRPCLSISGYIGQRLDNRLRMNQSIDERALTEDLVDRFDSSSAVSAWNGVLGRLRDQQIRITTNVQKASQEWRVGADIGMTIQRSTNEMASRSFSTYAVLVQCKRIDRDGHVLDFFHEVKGSGKRQSQLMLDITPSSFYFLFVPPTLVDIYCTVEPLAFAKSAPGCSSPIWNMGCFAFDSPTIPFLSQEQKAEATGILVVPALAVQAQEARGKDATIMSLLPNSLPFWYWFGEMLVPGFIGDSSARVLAIAKNTFRPNAEDREFGVRNSIQFGFGNAIG